MLKSRKLPKIFKRICMVYVAMLVIMVFNVNYAMAEELPGWADTLYEFYNDSWIEVTDACTEYRTKYDYTSSYAYNDASNTDIERVFVLAPGYVDATYGAYKNLPRGQAYYFPNYVKEWGNNSAALKFWPVYGEQGMYLHIWWSPDSI